MLRFIVRSLLILTLMLCCVPSAEAGPRRHHGRTPVRNVLRGAGRVILRPLARVRIVPQGGRFHDCTGAGCR